GPSAQAPGDGPEPTSLADSLAAMDTTAREYVSLVLELGTHDDGYVDAYYGPPEWRDMAEAEPRTIDEIAERAAALAAEMEELSIAGSEGDPGAAPPSGGQMAELRRVFLAKQLGAVAARARIVGGETMSFDEESQVLYDAQAPHQTEEEFAATVEEIDGLIPGDGPLVDRLAAWREEFTIPPDKIDAVFQAAIEACRERTAAHVRLPESEGFTVEYVTDQPWSGYNWYQGDYQSLIQVNTELPIRIDRAVDLACHEGYPGHHAFNMLLEKHLARDREWVEFMVYPLFSPMSLLAEGTANYGIEVAFPGEERVAFERDVLFPLAGLDPARAEEYYAVGERMQALSFAGNEAARLYLDGHVSGAQAVEWMERYALAPPERAEQRIRFLDTYRSYVINYNLGQQLVREWVEANGGTADDPERRWQVFTQLLTTPRTPSGIAVEEEGEAAE
ncbi:MAG TPA: hypothetical protein VKU40_03310, partial [Thermoanaerobaculia bacterium]|nr:hypothetical protein [Thermoanaerobaculia bacterium]